MRPHLSNPQNHPKPSTCQACQMQVDADVIHADTQSRVFLGSPCSI